MNELYNKRAELVIVELEGGAKWRYLNLYFLARLLEAAPGVRQMIFTEARGGEGGFLSACAHHRSSGSASKPPFPHMQNLAGTSRSPPI